jgi:hypothetical protein
MISFWISAPRCAGGRSRRARPRSPRGSLGAQVAASIVAGHVIADPSDRRFNDEIAGRSTNDPETPAAATGRTR